MDREQFDSIEPFDKIETLHSLTKGISAVQFHEILSSHQWNLIIETLDYIRSYELGLEIGLRFLQYAEIFKDSFSEKEHNHHLRTLFLFILHYLDKLDKWEEYLHLWKVIRENTNFTIQYTKNVKEEQKHIVEEYFDSIDQYIISEEEKTLQVHFLYCISNRKKVIERKLTRKQAGKKLGNQFHARQEELSQEELKRRYNFMMKKAQYVKEIYSTLERMRYR
jgi:hypothetical protein